MMQIYVSKLTIIGSDNGLSPGRRQAIIWTNASILLIWPLGTNVSEFPHLAIVVSPRLEVESSGHAWLDGCNFQRKQLLAPEYRQRHPV